MSDAAHAAALESAAGPSDAMNARKTGSCRRANVRTAHRPAGMDASDADRDWRDGRADMRNHSAARRVHARQTWRHWRADVRSRGLPRPVHASASG